MTKPSITILVKPSGTIEVLAASHDAQDTLDAFLTCDKEGEVFHYRKVSYDKRKAVSYTHLTLPTTPYV